MYRIIILLTIYLSGLGITHAQESPRLSPLPVEAEIEKLPLAGKWKFSPSPGEGFWKEEQVNNWRNIEVPGQWLMQGFEVEKGKEAGYFRTFNIPSEWNGKRIKLRCNGIFSESRIYINGKEAGYHLGGFTAFELEITALLQTGKENRIAIGVVSESVADSTASASRYAVHSLGGISRDIYLVALPGTNLSSFHAHTTFDAQYTDATLTAEVAISNETALKRDNLSLDFTLSDASGKVIDLGNNLKPVQELGPNSSVKIKVPFQIIKPEQWNSEHPYLYHFTCRLRSGDEILHTTSRRIGFRQIEVRGNELFVNNKPVKLRGVCRHEVMPLRGRSLTGDIWKKDVELFRQANVNYIRTSHYPPDEALLDACDELGMFVEEEAPFCWAHETKVPESKHYAVLVNQHLEMVNRDRSHPSVIIWSMGNESNLYTEYFKEAAKRVKETDPTRPCIFSQWGPDADNGELDIANHHYPGPDGPNQYRNSKRPVIFDEYCHLNAYNRQELAADPGLRYMWGRLLDKMWNDMYHSKGVLGGALWAGIDDTFFLPGGIPVGYGTWGPIDGWRREKPEYWETKKAYSPVRISLKQNMDANGLLVFDVENRHNFTNLYNCTIQWKAGNTEGVVQADIAPRSKGTFTIQLPEELHQVRDVELVITGVRGFVLDEYKFRVLPELIHTPAASKVKLSGSETDHHIHIALPLGRLTIDKRNGLLTVTGNKGKTILQGSPSLMLLPLNPEGEGIQMTKNSKKIAPYTPLCSDWVCESVTKEQNDKGINIRVKGSYQEAEGCFTYTITSDGSISVSYDFAVSRNISPRQTGIVFTLPESFNELQWKRKGYWNVYPADHIGALEGKTRDITPDLPLSGIAGPQAAPAVAWSADQTINGSNMFRSTKENITEASLTGQDGRFTVVSDGTQHTRAWKEEHVIHMLVADYNNAGNERFLISHAEKEYRPLRTGDRVTGTVRIKLEHNPK